MALSETLNENSERISVMYQFWTYTLLKKRFLCSTPFPSHLHCVSFGSQYSWPISLFPALLVPPLVPLICVSLPQVTSPAPHPLIRVVCI